MEIIYTREYKITSELTAAAFIQAVDETMMLYDGRLDSLDMGDAVAVAVNLFVANELNPGAITIEEVDAVYNYVNCPDSRTLLDYDEETGEYTISPGTNQPGFRSPYEIARDALIQGRDLINCISCKHGPSMLCFDAGQYTGWLCHTWLDAQMNAHFAGKDLVFTDITGDGTQMIEMKGWTPDNG